MSRRDDFDYDDDDYEDDYLYDEEDDGRRAAPGVGRREGKVKTPLLPGQLTKVRTPTAQLYHTGTPYPNFITSLGYDRLWTNSIACVQSELVYNLISRCVTTVNPRTFWRIRFAN